MPETVVIVSDIHAGYERSNLQDFRRFLGNNIPSINPDTLVIAGDLFDFWRGGISSVMSQHAGLVEDINRLSDSGINVVYLYGNHDERFKESMAPEPWQVDREYEFTSGEEKFIVEHGNMYDPANANPKTNEWLCLTGDAQADRINRFYERLQVGVPFSRTVLTREPLLRRPSTDTLAHLNNPDVLTQSDMRGRAERIDLRADMAHEQTVIIGHTHVPRKAEGVINVGSWTKENRSFCVVSNGSAELNQQFINPPQ